MLHEDGLGPSRDEKDGHRQIDLDKIGNYRVRLSLAWFFALVTVLIGVISFVLNATAEAKSIEPFSFSCQEQKDDLWKRIEEKESKIQQFIAIHPDLVDDSTFLNKRSRNFIGEIAGNE